MRSGLGFKVCDIGVITNIQEDHLGISDIHDLKDLSRVKSVVVESVKKDGWAVLNGGTKIVLISPDPCHVMWPYLV